MIVRHGFDGLEGRRWWRGELFKGWPRGEVGKGLRVLGAELRHDGGNCYMCFDRMDRGQCVKGLFKLFKLFMNKS